MTTSSHLLALVREGESYLQQHGVKGMKWGVRTKRDGSGAVKVKFRPTYDSAEKRGAKQAAKTAKKSKSSAVDTTGADLGRVAKLRTPSRRVVNAVLGTKVSNITAAAAVAGTVGVGLATFDPVAIGVGAKAATLFATATNTAIAGTVGATAYSGTKVYDLHKAFFSNYLKNPTVRLKADLTPSEMAKYSSGKEFSKAIMTQRGSAVVSVKDGKATVIARDREGRPLGGATRVGS